MEGQLAARRLDILDRLNKLEVSSRAPLTRGDTSMILFCWPAEWCCD